MLLETIILQEATALHREAAAVSAEAAEALVAQAAVLAVEAVVDNANRHFDRPKGVEKSTAKKRSSI